LIIRAKASVRISLAGGGMVVSPYIAEKGGFVITATINKSACVTLVPGDVTIASNVPYCSHERLADICLL
jgi:galactokinase/mevalonate kinase-like predicted kinase